MTASFINNRISLIVPGFLADDWTQTTRIGIEGEMEIGNGKKLFLSIEKDFKCLDHVTEDQSDNYPNPTAVLQNS